MVRISFTLASYANGSGLMKGEIEIMHQQTLTHPYSSARCQAEVTPGTTNLEPVEGEFVLPVEFKNETYHKVVTDILKNYYQALSGVPAYVWLEEVPNDPSQEKG